jgi:hypothetical protein
MSSIALARRIDRNGRPSGIAPTRVPFGPCAVNNRSVVRAFPTGRMDSRVSAGTGHVLVGANSRVVVLGRAIETGNLLTFGPGSGPSTLPLAAPTTPEVDLCA